MWDSVYTYVPLCFCASVGFEPCVLPMSYVDYIGIILAKYFSCVETNYWSAKIEQPKLLIQNWTRNICEQKKSADCWGEVEQ